jgi:hypothetical protein
MEEQDAVKEELRSTTIDQNVTAGKSSYPARTPLHSFTRFHEAEPRCGKEAET